MSYSYCFEFFKPGKKSYTGVELLGLLGFLQNRGYKLKFPPGDTHLEIQTDTMTQLAFKPQETKLSVDLIKDGQFLDLILGPADGEHGQIGLLAISDEQFREKSQENAKLLFTTAMYISGFLKPYFSWGDHELELDKLSHCLRFDRIGALAWANFFSKEFLEEIGGVEKILLDPENKTEKKEVGEILETFSIAPLELSATPVETSLATIALEFNRRFPEALLRSFEIPHPNAIEVEP